MAKISELTQVLETNGTELVPVVTTNENGTKENKVITTEKLAEGVKNSQDLVNRTELEQAISNSQAQSVTEERLQDALTAKSNIDHNHDSVYSNKLHTHSYADLTGKPDLPNISQQDIEDINNQILDLDARVTSNDTSIESIINILDSISTGGASGGESSGGSGTGGSADGHTHSNLGTLDIITPSKIIEWDNKSDFSGNYNDLVGKPVIPTVPTKTSQLTNDSGFMTEVPSEYITETELEENLQNKGYLTKHQDLSAYAFKTEIPTMPTKVSELENDAGYLTESQDLSMYALKSQIPEIPQNVSVFNNDAGYLTEIPNMDNLVTKDDLNNLQNFHTHDNKNVLDTITQDDIDRWNSSGGGGISDYDDLLNKLNIPTKISQLKNDVGFVTEFTVDEKIDEVIQIVQNHLDNHPSGGDGSGTGGAVANLTSDFEQTVFNVTDRVVIPYNFISANVGRGTLYVEIVGDSSSTSTNTYPIKSQGDSSVDLGLFEKGSYTITMYALDYRGVQTNSLIFKINVGALEITSTFNDVKDYNITDTILIPITVTTVSESTITATVTIDEVEYTQELTKGYNAYTVPSDAKTVGVHKITIQCTSGDYTSNTLSYNLVIIGNGVLLLSTKVDKLTIDYGYKIELPYKISMSTSATVNVKYYINDELKATYDLPTGNNTMKLSDRIDSGDYILKIVATYGELTSTLTTPLTVRESTFTPVETVTTGLVAYFDASNKSNFDEDKSTWVSKVQKEDGSYVTATLNNYNYSSNGWESGWLHSTVGTYTTIDLAPLADNALNGFTFDILYRSKHSGDDNNIVVDCTSESTEVGFRITSDKATIKGDSNIISNVYMDNEETRITFVIDRNSTYVDKDGTTKENPMVQIYLNGVLSSASILTDSGDGSNRIYESFATASKIHLNGLSGEAKNGESYIKTIRVYNRALSHEEILQNLLADIEDVAEQKAEYERNYTLLEQIIPTIYMYDSSIGKFANMTKDNKQYVRVRYESPNEEKFGASFDFPVCQTAWQGTSSLQYPIKNYKFKCYDYSYRADGVTPVSTTNTSTFIKKKINPFTDGTGYPETTFCLKADYMESSHARNTGTAKFVNDVLFKDTPNPATQQDSKLRETINGFPVVLYINNERIGIYNFNHDKSCSKSLGHKQIEDFFRFEISANSETTTGAFNKTWTDGDINSIYSEILSDFEIAYDEDKFEANDGSYDITSYYDALNISHTEDVVLGGYKDRALLALAEFIQFVSEATEEEFKANLSKYCDIEHAIRYWINVQMFGMIDNYAKNTMINCYDGHKFYFTFYDMDSSIGLDNTGYNVNESDIEMMDKESTGGYVFNCATSKMWNKLFRCFYTEICDEYKLLRNGAFTIETMKKYLVEEQIDRIPIILYNQDQFSKYISQGRQYLHMLHGRNKEHILRWLDYRIKYLDSLFLGIESIYTSKSITIRSNNPNAEGTTYTATLNITPYYTQYITVKWRNGEFETHKVKKGETQIYSFNMVNATDNEILVYCADNIKTLGSLTNLNPSSLDIGNAVNLIELDASNSTALLKADVSKNVKLQTINFNGCTMLGDSTGGSGANILDVRNCTNLTYVDIRETLISNVLNNTVGCAIETLHLSENTAIVYLNNYTRLKNFSCGSNIISFTAINTQVNVTDYLSKLTNAETIVFDNCYCTTTSLTLSKDYPNLKNLTLKNLDSITTVTFAYNRNDSRTVYGGTVTLSDMGFTMNYLELGNLPNLTSLTLGKNSSDTTTTYLGFDNNNSTIYLHDLPKLTSISTYVGYTGLNRLVIPDSLTTFTFTYYSTTSSSYSKGDFAMFNNISTTYGNFHESFYTLDTILSYTAYKNNPTARNVVRLTNSNCEIVCKNQKSTKKLINYDDCSSLYIRSNGVAQYLLKKDSKVTNSTIRLQSTSSSYPSASYPFNLYGIDFRNCSLDVSEVYGGMSASKANYTPIKYCTFDGWDKYAEILGICKVGFSEYVSNNTFTSSLQVTGSNCSYAFYNSTINGDVRFSESLSDGTHALDGATVTGEVVLNQSSSPILDYFMNQCNTEKAPILPLNTSSANYCFYGSTITKTPDNWERYYTGSLSDISSEDNIKAYTNCNIESIGKIVDGEISEWVDGTINDIYTTWGGNKTPTLPKSTYEITLTESDVPFTFTLSTDSNFVKYYQDDTIWGDGVTDTSDTHIYTAAGTYTLQTTKAILDIPSCSKITRIEMLQNNYIYSDSNGLGLLRYMSNVSYINLGRPSSDVGYIFSGKDLTGNTNEVAIHMNCSKLTTLTYLFYSKSNAEGYCLFRNKLSLNFTNMNNITSLYAMFKFGCRYLKEIEFLTFDTSSVTSMAYMFDNVMSITTLDLSLFNTEKVTNMNSMFNECRNLTNIINLNNLNTTSAVSFSEMFYNCSSLTTLDVSNFDTSNVTSLSNMFYDCSNLKTINLFSSTSGKLKSIQGVFWGCNKLENITSLNFNTSNVTTMSYLFSSCSSLTSLDLSNFNTSSVTNMAYMFQGCTGLTSLNLSNFNTSGVTTSKYMLDVSPSVDFCYTGENYLAWTLSESSTNFGGTFPWNASAATLSETVEENTNNIETLQEDTTIMMLAMTELYEQQNSNSSDEEVATASTFSLRASSLSSMDRYMVSIYSKLIANGLKTIDEVPEKLRPYI